MKFILISIAVACTLKNLEAQLSVVGKYRHLVNSSLQKAGSLPSNSVKEYRLPDQDNEQLLAWADAEEWASNSRLSRKEVRRNDNSVLEEFTYTEKTPKATPFTFGKAIPLSISLTDPEGGEWTVHEDTKTRMWRFKIYSKDAHSISVYFSDFHLAPSTELYIIGRGDTLGAFTSLNNKETRAFGIAPVAGDFLILEYIEPLNLPTTSSLVVSHSVHGFRHTPFSFKAIDSMSGSCNINVACPEGSEKNDSIDSVALLIDAMGTSFCTGAMINNVQNDGKQLFLTAEHCVGQDNVTNYMFGFHYQYKYCSSVYESKPNIKTVHGARLLGKSKETDYALLEIVENIPDVWDVFMAGWYAAGPNKRTGSFFGIHHPRGDTKKVSISDGSIELIRVTNINPNPNFWKVTWNRGVTEPGSSGSPLFNSKGLIIGHLLGGDSSCRRQKLPDLYGAVSRDWTLSKNPLSKLLDPLESGTMELEGASLKDLRSGVISSKPKYSDSDNILRTVTSTVTRFVDVTTTSTVTIARSTKVITSRVTVSVTGEKVTTTRDVFKTVTAPAERTTVTRDVLKTVMVPTTITTTFTRNPPQIISTRTVTVKA